MSTTTPQTTSLLSGRYQMEKIIGRGGMSTVYRATDTVLGRPVAVKVLLAALAESDPSHIARLRREARAAASLRHPAVVKIYDTGSEDGSHYIVMEYVAGRALHEVIRDRRLGHREAARITSEVAEAVAAAHAAGVLHRDIKPANVILRPDGSVKVFDFGVARTVQDTTITNPALAVGTVAYMAPERVLGRPGDERTDIYGIGCLLYALLTSHPPFVADEAVAILHQHMHAEPVPPSSVGAAVPPGLERLVLRMLAKDPAERPQSAAEVAGLLAAAGSTEATLVVPAGRARTASTSGGTAIMPVARPSAGTHTPRPRAVRHRRRRLPVTLLAVAAAVIVVVALAIAAGGGADRPVRAAASRGAPSRIGARLGRAAVTATATHRAALQTSAQPQTSPQPQTSTSPAPAKPPGGPAAGAPPSGQAKKAKPPKPPKPPKHMPPGHGGIPPGQLGKGPKH